jgi:hypothetical protein
MPGYCTEEDVQRALQESDLTGDVASAFVDPAIAGQTEWVRKRTKRHWYDSGDQTGDLFTAPVTVTNEQCSIPSTRHPEARQFKFDDPRQYPKLMAGPYTRIGLAKRALDTLTTLEVRDRAGDLSDWTSEMTEGRGEDYYTHTDPHSDRSYVYLRGGALPALWDYADAVRVTYDYGIDGIPDTIRRAVAFRAGAELVLDDDVKTMIQDSGQLVNVETKAQAMRNRAEELLSPYMTTPVA